MTMYRVLVAIALGFTFSAWMSAQVAANDRDALRVYCTSSFCHSTKAYVNIQPRTLVKFQCRRTSGDVQGKITWIKGGSILTESDCPYSRPAVPCTTKDSGKTLILKSITVSTTISCQADGITSSQFTVTVIESLPVANSSARDHTPIATGKMSASTQAEVQGTISSEVRVATPRQNKQVGSLRKVTSKGTRPVTSKVTSPAPTHVNKTQTFWSANAKNDEVGLVFPLSVGLSVLVITVAVAIGICMYIRRNSQHCNQLPEPQRQELQGSIGLRDSGGAGEEDVSDIRKDVKEIKQTVHMMGHQLTEVGDTVTEAIATKSGQQRRLTDRPRKSYRIPVPASDDNSDDRGCLPGCSTLPSSQSTTDL